ncbi:protein kinase C and casein kinase substrate in neurons protein 1-like [Spea bombifrons]|uniref:protein kinase C and casein kinase substrate in neurons protein 1-like n=1 Tax=Spea bombifrons TaxID=233779 RepID=UPI002349241B|nr:protein kinase C and casein kinase substrate in neurons protein 1-like [Spea bombifrons]XP_053308153.1 protein kinase C and casein kinase substrate in neurons protein 1-like [Spea bombifrons]XP_053308154.1 protein kinase C and casein kinase substrate in neurons protein 1-like [Spea bombifrons]
MSVIYSEVTVEDVPNDSFWMPNNYSTTVKRVDDGYRLCDEIVACFQDRAKIEKQYAVQMEEWTRKWKPLVNSSPMYGSLLHAWQAFMSATERLSELHTEIQKSLLTDDSEKIRKWQRETYHRKLFGGFKESSEIENGFCKAQKPWAKKLKKVEKTKAAYHKACRKEHLATIRENNGKINPELSQEKQKKLTEDHEKYKQDKEKVKQRYEKSLQELNKYNPKYMEDMECVFDQSQQMEQKKILFLKQALLSVHKHLDITRNEGVQIVYNDLSQAITAVNDQDDLKWWRNKRGPGMLMNWPQLEEWSPDTETRIVKKKKVKETEKVTLYSVTPTESSLSKPPVNVPGVRVRAVYDYVGQEADELSFKAGDELTKIEDEDDQGWCKGVTDRGHVGLYPANYVEVISG